MIFLDLCWMIKVEVVVIFVIQLQENMIEVLYILKVFFGCINIGNDIGNMF